ncbi:MAG: type II toxin-antitoxin system VapC family toxin [Cyanobacteria bacterium J06648_1]
MIILDTNILSELMRPQPNKLVSCWIGIHKATDLFITALTKAEILYGLEILSEGKRRTALKQAATSMFDVDFSRRILPFDSDAAQQFAIIAAKRKKIGRPISQIDAQIAAIALCHDAILATRNIPDFEECGIEIINPWEQE